METGEFKNAVNLIDEVVRTWEWSCLRIPLEACDDTLLVMMEEADGNSHYFNDMREDKREGNWKVDHDKLMAIHKQCAPLVKKHRQLYERVVEILSERREVREVKFFQARVDAAMRELQQRQADLEAVKRQKLKH